MKIHTSYITAIVILAGVVFLLFDRVQKSNEKIKHQQSVISEKDAEIQYRLNEVGQLIASKAAAELTTRELAQYYPTIVDELKKQFDIKIKDVKVYMRHEFEARSKGTAAVTNYYNIKDSTGQYPKWKLKVDDGYLSFNATVYDSLNAPYKYTYIDTITTVVATKKKWILGSEKLLASSSFKNKNARITGSTNLLIDSYRDKRWVVSAGVSYLPFTNQFQPSITIGYALIKF